MIAQNRCLGIDLARHAKHKAVLSQNSPAGRRSANGSFAFAHDLEGFTSLLDYLRRQTGADAPRGMRINLEPTGGVWETLAAFLDRQGAEVFFTRTDLVAALRKAQEKYGKTDRLDARTLSAIPWSMPERMIRYVPPEPRIHALRELSAQRQRLAEEIARWKNRLLAKLGVVWQPLLAMLDDEQRLGKLTRAFFKKFADPRQVVKYGVRRLETWFGKNAHGNTSRKLLETLWDGAGKTARLWDELQRTGAIIINWETNHQLLRQDLRLIETFEKEQKALDRQIKQARAKVPECDIIQQLPGVGDVIAPSLVSILSPVTRFANCKKVSSYTGYTSRPKASGDHQVQGLKITKTGNRRLKRNLALAADLAMRLDPELAAFAIRLLQRGKHYNQVRVAVGRKLALRAYSLLKRHARGEPNLRYRWRDLKGNTIDKKEARELAQLHWAAHDAETKRKKKSAGRQ